MEHTKNIKLYKCYDGNQIRILSSEEIKNIKAVVTKKGEPMMMINYYCFDYCINSTLFCDRIEIFDPEKDDAIVKHEAGEDW